MSGTIGEDPITMIITLENRTHPTKAHYSSASGQKIIPLTVQVAGNHVVLSGQDKEVFRLHFVAGSREKADPLSFYTASGMQGMWSDGTKTLPVSLQFILSRDHLTDCIFYPHHLPDDKPVPAEKRCEQDADMAALRQCIHSPYTSDDAVESCIETRLRPATLTSARQISVFPISLFILIARSGSVWCRARRMALRSSPMRSG